MGELCSPEGTRVAGGWPAACATKEMPRSHWRNAYWLLRKLIREVCIPRVWYDPRYRMSERWPRSGLVDRLTEALKVKI